ncbi:MAG TPA: hypothetical protein QF468_02190, partial [Nitrospinota bacterium]|nr:hypothetical protein [Nitrospinota bacterium]
IHNLRIKEVPVSYRKRIGESKITGTFSGTVRAGIKIIYTILKLALILQKTRFFGRGVYAKQSECTPSK